MVDLLANIRSAWEGIIILATSIWARVQILVANVSPSMRWIGRHAVTIMRTIVYLSGQALTYILSILARMIGFFVTSGATLDLLLEFLVESFA